MQAVTVNGRSLLVTALLCFVIVYLYSIAGFVMFPDDFRNAESNEFHCQTVYQCFIFVMTSGVRAGGGIGDLLTERKYSQNAWLGRVAYDFSFFVIVIVCLLNIVSGIIIDTFAQLRDQREEILSDTQNRCFICHLDANAFDRRVEGGFEEHVKKQHNMWGYLYFMHHLRRKPVHEFTGQESYVWEKMQRKDISFFPLNKSLDYENAVHEDKAGDMERMEAAGPQQQAILPTFDNAPSAKESKEVKNDQLERLLEEKYQASIEMMDKKIGQLLTDIKVPMEEVLGILRSKEEAAGGEMVAKSNTTLHIHHTARGGGRTSRLPGYMQPTASSAQKNKPNIRVTPAPVDHKTDTSPRESHLSTGSPSPSN